MCFVQLKCFISAICSYACLKFVFDIGSLSRCTVSWDNKSLFKILPQLGSRLAVLDTTTLEAAFIGFTRIQSLVPENIFPMKKVIIKILRTNKKRDRAEQKIKVQISSENVSTTFEVT